MTKKVIAAYASTFAVLVIAVLLSFTLLNAEPSAANKDEQVYKLKTTDAYPDKDKWPNNRRLTDSENGLQVTYLNNTTNSAYSVRNTKTIAVDGAHTKVTFNSTNKKFSVTINNGGKSYNDSGSGLTFIMNLADGALYLNVDGVPQDLSQHEGYNGTNKDRVIVASMKGADSVVIKTSIADNGDFVFNVNDYELVIAQELWSTSKYLDVSKGVFFLLAPQGQVLDYTWNYLHGGDKLCFAEVEKELGAETTANIVESIMKIQQISLPVSISSQESIDAAKVFVDKVPEEHRRYIVNLADYEGAAKICKYLALSETALDSTIYSVETADLGPRKSSWPTTTVDWYEATSGKGATIDFNSTTVHNVCINYRGTVSLKDLHIQFANQTSSGTGDRFALILAGTAGMDVTNPNKPFSLEFYVSDHSMQVNLFAKGKDTIKIIDTNLIARASLMNRWSLSINELENGDYELSLCDSVVGIIPKAYIDAAVEAGLNLDALYITFGSNTRSGTPSGHTKVDVVSIHSGEQPCYDKLAKELGAETTESIVNAIIKISNIQTPITVESGLQVMEARDAVAAVPEEYKNTDYIYNLSDFEILSAMYDNMDQTIINLDPEVYPVDISDVGPDNRWPDMVDFHKADTGVGVTIKCFKDITVQQFGLNVKKAESLDNLHMQFDNFDSTGAGNQFAFIFSHATRADIMANNKCMWLIFVVHEDRVVVSLNAEGMASRTLIDTKLIGKASLANMWSMEFKKLDNGDYEFKLLGAIKGTIPKEYIEAAQGVGLNVDALYVTYSAHNKGNVQPTTSTIDIVSMHSGKEECYCKVSEGDYIATQQCKALIEAIGDVTESSGDAIKAATDAYNALSSSMQKLVTNSDVLVRATRDYNNIASDIKQAAVVIDAINKLPSNPKDATYEQLIDCYGRYLDLYPRCRKRVTNVDKLMAAVAAYEEVHPGIELKLETVNEYTGGKKAHYLNNED